MTKKIKDRNHNAHEYGRAERDYYIRRASQERVDEARKRETLRLYRRVRVDTSGRGGVRIEGALAFVTDPIDKLEVKIPLQEWVDAAEQFKKNG